MEDTFRPRDLQGQYQQQQTLSPSIPPAAIQNVSRYPTDQSFQSQSMNTTDDEERTTISQETILKIAELKRLVYRHHIFSDPDAIIKCAPHFCTMGDNTILDEKLEQLSRV